MNYYYKSICQIYIYIYIYGMFQSANFTLLQQLQLQQLLLRQLQLQQLLLQQQQQLILLYNEKNILFIGLLNNN